MFSVADHLNHINFTYTMNALSFIMNLHGNIKPKSWLQIFYHTQQLSHKHITTRTRHSRRASQSEACILIKPAFTVRSCKMLYIKRSLSVPFQVTWLLFNFDLHLWLHMLPHLHVKLASHTHTHHELYHKYATLEKTRKQTRFFKIISFHIFYYFSLIRGRFWFAHVKHSLMFVSMMLNMSISIVVKLNKLK